MGTSLNIGNRDIILGLQNFVAWKAHFLNRIKSLKSPELEAFAMFKKKPAFLLPVLDTMIPDPRDPNRTVRKYTDDTYGKEECTFHRSQIMKREVRFGEALPMAVAIAYSTIGAVIMRKMVINPEYQLAHMENDILKILEMAEFHSMGKG